jgi:hypothetical protein
MTSGRVAERWGYRFGSPNDRVREERRGKERSLLTVRENEHAPVRESLMLLSKDKNASVPNAAVNATRMSDPVK